MTRNSFYRLISNVFCAWIGRPLPSAWRRRRVQRVRMHRNGCQTRWLQGARRQWQMHCWRMHHRCVGSEFVPTARRKSWLLNAFGFRALYIWGNNNIYTTTRAPFFFFVGSPKFASPFVGPFFLTFLIMACTMTHTAMQAYGKCEFLGGCKGNAINGSRKLCHRHGGNG